MLPPQGPGWTRMLLQQTTRGVTKREIEEARVRSARYFAQHRAKSLSVRRLNERTCRAGGSNSICPAIQDWRSFCSIARHRRQSIRLKGPPSHQEYFIVAISYLVNNCLHLKIQASHNEGPSACGHKVATLQPCLKDRPFPGGSAHAFTLPGCVFNVALVGAWPYIP